MDGYTFLDFNDFASTWLSTDEFELVRDLEILLCVSRKTNTIQHAILSKKIVPPRGIMAQRQVIDKVIDRVSRNLGKPEIAASESKNSFALGD